MDLDSVRTFVTVADTGRFQDAAADLSVTQQAVSKRVAGLEKDLGVQLFARTPRGAQLTIDGQAFLPHARELLRAEERAVASVLPGRRPLRIDVINRRIASAELLRGFHRMHPEIALDVVALLEMDAALAAIRSGTIDATFRAVTVPPRRLPDGVSAARVLDEPLELIVGARHPLASARSVRLEQLVGHRIWIPGIVAGSEWGEYYEELAEEFGLDIDAVGPNFGTEPLLDAVAESTSLATVVGEQTRLVWPAEYGLRRVRVEDPVPVYPHSLLWQTENPHPGLAALRDYLSARRRVAEPGTWVPVWAR
jgi:DNA-binding transcriptional LysR family regulator